MPILRKQSKPKSNVDSFIKGAATTSSLSKTEEPLTNKTGRKLITISLMEQDAAWVKQLLRELNQKTARKITRSEILSVAIATLQAKPTEEILRMTKER